MIIFQKQVTYNVSTMFFINIRHWGVVFTLYICMRPRTEKEHHHSTASNIRKKRKYHTRRTICRRHVYHHNKYRGKGETKRELPPQEIQSRSKLIQNRRKVVKNGKNASYLDVFLTRNMTSIEERDKI